jgi:HD-GYP domain-containing protein (c-di-GMP phosphodiesterase class II)
VPKVDLQQIVASTITKGSINFDLFAKRQGRMILFCRKGFEITDQHIESLQRHGLSYFIRQSDWGHYLQYAEGKVDQLIDNTDISEEMRSQMLHTVNRKRMDTVLRDPYTPEAIEQSELIVENYVRFILADKSAVKNLFNLASLDAYTYSHALNVCSMSILMAEQLFGDDEKVLLEAGLAGLMHDIGKLKISDEIIRKNGKLTEDEFTEIKKHPGFSEEIIRHHKLSPDIQQAGRFHHENYCGGGYPDNLHGDQIPVLARLVAVVDVYDALTSKRSYKNEIRNIEALKVMHNESRKFDSTLFNCLMHIVLKSPDLVRQFASRRRILCTAS